MQTFGEFATVSSGAFWALSHVDPTFGMAELKKKADGGLAFARRRCGNSVAKLRAFVLF